LRKFALLALRVCGSFVTNFASAQQGDIMLGGSTLMSPTINNDSVNFQPPAEKGGTYFNVSGDFIKFKHHLGLNVETAWRDKGRDYSRQWRKLPAFPDRLQRSLPAKVKQEVSASILCRRRRCQLSLLLPEATSCSIPTGGCTFYTSSNHFMEDLGGGVRYYVWHRLPHILSVPKFTTITSKITSSSTLPIVFRVGASHRLYHRLRVNSALRTHKNKKGSVLTTLPFFLRYR
jgi:hypothetical protein